MVLTRKGDVVFNIIKELRQAGIAAVPLVERGFFDTEEVKTILSFMQFLLNPFENNGATETIDVLVGNAHDTVSLDITAIDVTNINGRVDRRLSEIVLLTAHHTRILWGRPPGTRLPGELPPADKLRLLRLAAAKGMLNGPGEVDIRFPNQAIGRLPLRR